MFYWSISGLQIVLTDTEERQLQDEAGFTGEDRFNYLIATPEADKLEKRLGLFLEDYAREKPDEFHLRFVRRLGAGVEALDDLRALVDAYERTTGRAAWGAPDHLDSVDRLGLAAWLSKRPDAVTITLLQPTRRFFRRGLEVTGIVAFPSAEIEKFAGTGDSFVLITSTMSVHFGHNLVRVTSLPDCNDDDLP